jgi:signal peptidase I
MQPNFRAEQFLIVSRVSYLVDEPHRGDVVVFDPPGDAGPDPLLIKRLIGLPGEQVELREGQVYINGTPLEEPYIRERCTTRCADESWELGANEYFFMGDNRNNSRDSRVFGQVTRDRIIGEAIVRYWPLPDIAVFTGYQYPEG